MTIEITDRNAFTTITTSTGYDFTGGEPIERDGTEPLIPSRALITWECSMFMPCWRLESVRVFGPLDNSSEEPRDAIWYEAVDSAAADPDAPGFVHELVARSKGELPPLAVTVGVEVNAASVTMPAPPGDSPYL